MPWQTRLLDHWLAYDDDGRWVSPTVCLEVPRQNGKSEGVLAARCAYGLIVLGERIIFTSHRVDAMLEFYGVLRKLLENPKLRRYVSQDDFHTGAGRETITTSLGNSVKFIARSKKGGRSKHSDLIVLDESQFLDQAQLASVTPTQNTAPNPQIIYAGTPPDDDEGAASGYVFGGLRKDAIEGRRDICYSEWSAKEMPKDLSERDVWYETNPSLGYIIFERNIELQLANLEPEKFAREILGYWSPSAGKELPAIDPEVWDGSQVEAGPKPAKDERVACGVKFSPDGKVYSLSMAARSAKSGYTFIECVDRSGTARGIKGLAEWIAERKGKVASVCIDGRSWAPTLASRLRDAGFPKSGIHIMRAGELADACGMLSAGVEEKTVTHIAQPLLRESLAASPRRPIGKDGWAFGGDDPTPIESCAIALWGVVNTKRNPKRKMMVNV